MVRMGIGENPGEVLENAPCAFVSSRPNGVIVSANAKLEEWSGKSRGELLGGMRFQELLTKAGQIYYETHIRPLLLMQGHVKEIACQLQREPHDPLPIFMNCSLKRGDDGEPLLVRATLFDASDRAKYEEELRLRRREADHLAAIITASKDAIVSMSLDLTVRTWNAGAVELFGYSPEEAIGKSIDDLIVPDSRRDEREQLFESVRENNTATLLQTERRRKDGTLVPVELRASSITDLTGRATGISVIMRDITERREAEERISFIMRELGHRTKNLIGVVQAIARLSARTSNPETFLDGFTRRLNALSASQDLLVSGEWRGVDFESLARTHLSFLSEDDGSRLSCKGPPVRLNPKAAESLGMALHELATNAAKYGALSNETGKIEIAWTVKTENEEKLNVIWRETGGPTIKKPSRNGFGHVVMKRMVENTTGGKVVLEYPETGLIWELSASLGTMLEGDTAEIAGP